jgi:hypothetical protein
MSVGGDCCSARQRRPSRPIDLPPGCWCVRPGADRVALSVTPQPRTQWGDPSVPPIEPSALITLKNETLRISPALLRSDKLSRIVPHPGALVGDPDDIVHIDWSEYWSGEPLALSGWTCTSGLDPYWTCISCSRRWRWRWSGSARTMYGCRRWSSSYSATCRRSGGWTIRHRQFSTTSGALGATVVDTPFRDVVAHAVRLDFSGDPFDRLIAANALAAGAVLVTKDERLLDQLGDSAIW